MDSQPQEYSEAFVHLQASRALQWASIALIGVFLASVISLILPIELLNPRWQAKLIESIRGGASFPLEGSLFMLVAAALTPGNTTLSRRVHLVQNFAGLLSAVFLIMIPLKALASIPGTPRLPEAKLSEPIASLKAKALQQINPQIEGIENQIQNIRADRSKLFRGFAIRDSVISLLYALAFGAIKRRPLSHYIAT